MLFMSISSSVVVWDCETRQYAMMNLEMDAEDWYTTWVCPWPRFLRNGTLTDSHSCGAKHFFTGDLLVLFFQDYIKIWIVPPLNRPCEGETTRTTWGSLDDQFIFDPPDISIRIPDPVSASYLRHFKFPSSWDPHSHTPLVFDTFIVAIAYDTPTTRRGTRWALDLNFEEVSDGTTGLSPATIASANLSKQCEFVLAGGGVRLKDTHSGYNAPNSDGLQRICLQGIVPPPPFSASPDMDAFDVERAKFYYGFYSVVSDEDDYDGEALATEITIIHCIDRDPPPSNIALCPASGRMVYFRDNYVADAPGRGGDDFEKNGFDKDQEEDQEVFVGVGFHWRKPTLCVLDYLN